MYIEILYNMERNVNNIPIHNEFWNYMFHTYITEIPYYNDNITLGISKQLDYHGDTIIKLITNKPVFTIDRLYIILYGTTEKNITQLFSDKIKEFKRINVIEINNSAFDYKSKDIIDLYDKIMIDYKKIIVNNFINNI